METDGMLALLKADLDMLSVSAERETQLLHLLHAAAAMIAREGIVLDGGSVEDTQLQVMYAAWLYRKRASSDTAMPRMLRYAMNNRLVAQKVGEQDATQ